MSSGVAIEGNLGPLWALFWALLGHIVELEDEIVLFDVSSASGWRMPRDFTKIGFKAPRDGQPKPGPIIVKKAASSSVSEAGILGHHCGVSGSNLGSTSTYTMVGHHPTLPIGACEELAQKDVAKKITRDLVVIDIPFHFLSR